MNHFFFAFNLRGLSGVYYYWGKVGRMMEMTANHIMYWSDCHWHFVKMSQMQIFYTKSCNLCQARTRYMWIVGIFEKVVIDSHRKNQTYFGENLQFSFKTEGFQSHYSFRKTFSFSLKIEGNTNYSV